MKEILLLFTTLLTSSFLSFSYGQQSDSNLVTKQLLRTYPQDWLGHTELYTVNGKSLKTTKQNKFATILYPVAKIDSIGFHLDNWDFNLNIQNNYGILLSIDRPLPDTCQISQASWEGYFLLITGGLDASKSDTSGIKLIKHSGVTNQKPIKQAKIDRDRIANGLDISITYLSNGEVKFIIYYCNESHDTFFEGKTEAISRNNAYFGIYTNLNHPKNISINEMVSKTYNKTYLFSGKGEISNSANWLPERLVPMQSDSLILNGADSAVISQNMNVRSVVLMNSNLYVVNRSENSNTVVGIDSMLLVDRQSKLYLTNSATSKKSCIINLNKNANAQIFGSVIYDRTGNVPVHKINGADSASVVFEPMSRMVILHQKDGPFGGNGNSPAVVFKTGATFEQHDGESPLLRSGTVSPTVFCKGSVYQYYGGGITWSNSVYSILELRATGQTKVLMSGSGTCTIDYLKVLKGTYIFGLQGNNVRVNITIADSLTIIDKCKLTLSPVNAVAHSRLIIAASKVNGKGSLIIGSNADLEVVSPAVSWCVNTEILGKLRFGDQSIINLNSATMRISGSIENAGKAAYISTPNEVENRSAYLIRPVNGKEDSVLFPVGTAENGYSPMTISHNTGDTADFAVRSFVGVFEHGLYGNIVKDPNFLNNTWEITPDAAASVDVEIEWQKSAEGGAFDRSESIMMINHHRPTSNAWMPLTQSLFTDGNIYKLKSLAIADFSTITAWGESDPLALYFTDFTTKRNGNTIETSWQQTIPTDSVQIMLSYDSRNFTNIKTVTTDYRGRISGNIYTDTEQAVYLKINEYLQGNIVETSNIIAVQVSEKQCTGTLNIFSHGKTITIEKNNDEPVLIKLYSPIGLMISTELIDEKTRSIEYQLPVRCHHCIVHAENDNEQANAIVIDPE